MTDEADTTDTEKLAEHLYTVMVKRMGLEPDWAKQSEWIRENWKAVARASQDPPKKSGA